MKKTGMRIIGLLLMIAPFAGHSQKPDTLIKKLDSLSKKTDSAGGQVNNIKQSNYNDRTKITLPAYFILLGDDMKQAFLKPFHMTGRDWGKVGLFAVVEGGLSLLDEPIQKKAVDITASNHTIANISNKVTNFGGMYEVYTLGALGAYSLIFKNEKVKTTTLLATQAYITGAAVESVVKYITGRTRPEFYGPGQEAEPSFKGPFGKYTKGSNGSFPSGHTTVAFAAATVFAKEYADKPLVPIIAYSAATLIGLSRITENKHWATDVLAGAALGYLTGRLVVNNYHRYARIKNGQKPPTTQLSLNMQYNFGKLMPGLTYRF